MKFFFIFSQSNLNFRLAEFSAICKIFDIPLDEKGLTTENHAIVVDLPSTSSVEQILSRSVLVKCACELLLESDTLDALIEKIDQSSKLFEPYDSPEQSFASKYVSIGRKKDRDQCALSQKVGEHFPFTRNTVNLKSPTNCFVTVEEYSVGKDERPKRVYFGRMIGEGQYRLMHRYNLKDRCYIGNTTMDPELAFLQANITGIHAGDIVLDPFNGTGGLLLPAAHFGAYVLGTEINWQVAKAKGRSSRQGVAQRGEDESVVANFEQYGISEKFISTIIADASIHDIYRAGPIFDRIVSDPPYGVREKGRMVGRKNPRPDGIELTQEHLTSFPEKKVYELSNTFTDLLELAASRLVIQGTISFWYPVVLDKYSEATLPRHPCLQLISNCSQILTTRTARHLLTYLKLRDPVAADESAFIPTNMYENGQTFRKEIYNCRRHNNKQTQQEQNGTSRVVDQLKEK